MSYRHHYHQHHKLHHEDLPGDSVMLGYPPGATALTYSAPAVLCRDPPAPPHGHPSTPASILPGLLNCGSAHSQRCASLRPEAIGFPLPFEPRVMSPPCWLLYPGVDVRRVAGGAGGGPLYMKPAAPRETTGPLKAWLRKHRKNPYPTKAEKIMLSIITKMTLTQVSTWFANARRRLKKERSGQPPSPDEDDPRGQEEEDDDEEEIHVDDDSSNKDEACHNKDGDDDDVCGNDPMSASGDDVSVDDKYGDDDDDDGDDDDDDDDDYGDNKDLQMMIRTSLADSGPRPTGSIRQTLWPEPVGTTLCQDGCNMATASAASSSSITPSKSLDSGSQTTHLHSNTTREHANFLYPVQKWPTYFVDRLCRRQRHDVPACTDHQQTATRAVGSHPPIPALRPPSWHRSAVTARDLTLTLTSISKDTTGVLDLSPHRHNNSDGMVRLPGNNIPSGTTGRCSPPIYSNSKSNKLLSSPAADGQASPPQPPLAPTPSSMTSLPPPTSMSSSPSSSSLSPAPPNSSPPSTSVTVKDNKTPIYHSSLTNGRSKIWSISDIIRDKPETGNQ